jgi:hypothetical protein
VGWGFLSVEMGGTWLALGYAVQDLDMATSTGLELRYIDEAALNRPTRNYFNCYTAERYGRR